MSSNSAHQYRSHLPCIVLVCNKTDSTLQLIGLNIKEGLQPRYRHYFWITTELRWHLCPVNIFNKCIELFCHDFWDDFISFTLSINFIILGGIFIDIVEQWFFMFSYCRSVAGTYSSCRWYKCKWTQEKSLCSRKLVRKSFWSEWPEHPPVWVSVGSWRIIL